MRRFYAFLLVLGSLMPVAFVPSTPAPTHPGRFDSTTGDPSRLTAGQAGVPFLPDVLTGARLVVLIRFGTTWTDVSRDTIHEMPMTLIPGRPNEATTAPPARATLTLKNPDRRYSQFDPLSPNWPYVRENAILWVRLFVDGQYYTRFYGEIKTFKQGHDITGNYSVVTITAAGITQRLGQRGAPLKSALYRALSATSPLVYWPLEDTTGAVAAASGLPGGTPLNLLADGSVSTAPSFGSMDGPAGSERVPNFTSAASLAALTSQAASAGASWTVGFAVKFPAVTGANFCFAVNLFSTAGTVRYWNIMAFPGGVGGFSVDGVADSGATSFGIGTNFDIGDNQWHWVTVSANQDGPDISVEIHVDGNDGWIGFVFGQTLGPITSAQVNPAQTGGGLYPGVSHVGLWPGTYIPDLTVAMNGYLGESPRDRLTRLCAEEGVPFETVDYYASTVTMGAQGADSFMNLVRECELADAGFLYDGLSEGLRLQGISQRYDQFSRVTFDASNGEVVSPFEPVPDDFGRANRVTVSRKNGSSAIAEDTAGPLGTDAVGTYDASPPLPVNYSDDTLLLSRASWEVHKGSGRPGFRYPSVSLNLRKTPSKILSGSTSGWLTMTPGLHFTVNPPYLANNPSEDIRLVAEGWSEILSSIRWEPTVNCSRQDVYDVFKIEDSTLGRLQTGGSSIATDAPLGATSLSVATAAGQTIWTTTATFPGDFPLYLDIEGIKVKVTAIVGASSPQTFTVDGTTVTKPLYAGDTVALWRPGVIAL